MTANAESALNAVPVSRKLSLMEVITQYPVAFTVAVVTGAALVVGTLMLMGTFSDSDEAPIRVKDGSLDLYLLSTTQEWQQAGTSGNWHIDGTVRYKDEFEVTVAPKTGATCSGSYTGTGSDVVLSYGTSEVRLQSVGNHTQVRPGNGVTLTLASSQKLTYSPGSGFITAIAVGTGTSLRTICTFSAAGQLDHILMLNVP